MYKCPNLFAEIERVHFVKLLDELQQLDPFVKKVIYIIKLYLHDILFSVLFFVHFI
jgi:hypothetical protein